MKRRILGTASVQFEDHSLLHVGNELHYITIIRRKFVVRPVKYKDTFLSIDFKSVPRQYSFFFVSRLSRLSLMMGHSMCA